MEEEREEYKGFYYRIESDDSPESPRDWDNFGKMICFHGRYNLGDKHELSIEDAMELEKELNADKWAVVLPLYLYDHSGLRMKVGSFQGLLPGGHAEFDSGKVGFIYADREMILKEYGKKKMSKGLIAKVEKQLQSEVKVYDQYLSGDVHGYVIEDEGGNHLESCWGFYGYEYCLSEAKSIIDGLQKEVKDDLELRLAGNI